MCRTHQSGLLALGVIHVTCGLLICIAQGTVTAYLELRNSMIGRFMNVSPGLWFGAATILTGSLIINFTKRRTQSTIYAIVLISFCAISLGLAVALVVLDWRFLLEFKKWIWRKQRYSYDPNPQVDADFNMYHQLLGSRLDIEALFVLGASLMGLTILEVIVFVVSIAVIARYACYCCSEDAFVSRLKHKPKTTMIMVPSKDNLRHSVPLLTTEL